MWQQIDNKLYRFILVGMLNTLFGYSLFALFIFLQVHYTLAVLLTTVLGILFNFKTIGALVFKNTSSNIIVRFVIVYMITYLLNVLALKVLTVRYFDMYTAGLIALVPNAVISFLLQSKFVFVDKVILAAD